MAAKAWREMTIDDLLFQVISIKDNSESQISDEDDWDEPWLQDVEVCNFMVRLCQELKRKGFHTAAQALIWIEAH